jgi:hypothetical protein
MDITHEELECIVDRVVERRLRPVIRALRGIQQEEQTMDAAGEALQAEIKQLDADVQADNAAVVAGGEAVANAGGKFAELKAIIEKQVAGGALSDEEAAAMQTLAGEVDTHLGEATTQLTTHVKELGDDTAAA